MHSKMASAILSLNDNIDIFAQNLMQEVSKVMNYTELIKLKEYIKDNHKYIDSLQVGKYHGLLGDASSDTWYTMFDQRTPFETPANPFVAP